MPALFTLVRRSFQLAGASSDAFGRQALLVQVVRQNLFAYVTPVKTRGRWMLRGQQRIRIAVAQRCPATSGRCQERSRLKNKTEKKKLFIFLKKKEKKKYSGYDLSLGRFFFCKTSSVVTGAETTLRAKYLLDELIYIHIYIYIREFCVCCVCVSIPPNILWMLLFQLVDFVILVTFLSFSFWRTRPQNPPDESSL